MKLLKNILFVTAIFSVAAMANDSAVYSLPVKGVDPKESKINSTLVAFYGKQASEFMKLLPPVSTVPPYAQAVAKHNKTLVVSSNGYDLYFSCVDANIDGDGEGNVTVTALPEGTRCEVSLYEALNEGDTMDYVRDGGRDAVIQQLRN